MLPGDTIHNCRHVFPPFVPDIVLSDFPSPEEGGGPVCVHRRLRSSVCLHLRGSVHCVTADLVSGGVLAGEHHGGRTELERPEGGEDCAEASGGGRPDEREVDVEAGDDRGDETVTEAEKGSGHKEDRELEAVHCEARSSE